MTASEKFKVVHLIASSGLYGAEKWIYALMRAMDTSRFSSTLVNLYDATEGQSAVVAGAFERDLDAIDFNTGGSFNPLSIFKLSRWLKQNHIDIVHGHGYKSDIIGLMAGRLAGCKVISTPHGWTQQPDRKLQFYEWLDRQAFRLMDAVCPLSQGLYDSIVGYVRPDKIHLIMNGVDIDEITAAVPAFTKQPDEFIIGYIGRLIDDKDLPTLFKAVKQLLDDQQGNLEKKIRVMIVGDGDAGSGLHRLAEELGLQQTIEFLGYRADATNYLKCFDIFVLPSLSEGIPRCIMEAMAAGVPVAASDITGCRVLVKHDDTGWLFPPGDSDALFLILKCAIADAAACYSVKVVANQQIMEAFSNQKMGEDYQRLYSTLCNYDNP